MTPTDGALERYAGRLPTAMVAEIRRWRDDPVLARLASALDAPTTFHRFLDTYAEAVVAHHLRRRGCGLALEVPTPRGRACDFEVTCGDHTFFLHVKRVGTERPLRKLTISSRLRALERIRRPYVVSVRWPERSSDEDLQALVRQAGNFIQHARVGDELVARADDGREIGGVLILAPWEGTHVTLAIGLPEGFTDTTPRIRKLMQRAHRQFMPKAHNVVLICSGDHEDLESFDAALLGAHIERWDAFPPQGRRIAHGRDADGLWHGRRYVDWRAAGWFALSLDRSDVEVTMRYRANYEPDEELVGVLSKVFG